MIILVVNLYIGIRAARAIRYGRLTTSGAELYFDSYGRQHPVLQGLPANPGHRGTSPARGQEDRISTDQHHFQRRAQSRTRNEEDGVGAVRRFEEVGIEG